VKYSKSKSAAKPPHSGNGHVRARLPLIPLSEEGIWRTAHVMAYTAWSHSTLKNRIKEGKWPTPVKDGKLNGWPTSVCREALRKLGYPV
jgi:predicted DNA-binding transcriptional regulator AlpA